MLDIKWLLKNYESIAPRMADRCAPEELDELLALNETRKEQNSKYDELRFQQREDQKQLKQHKPGSDEFSAIRAELKSLSEQVKQLETARKETTEQFQQKLLEIPNVPHESVPAGRDESNNKVLEVVGEPPSFDFEPKAHWDLGEALGILNFEQAAKITGARFAVYHGAAARLERALISFMVDLHAGEHGYREVLPPFMVNSESMVGTGQFPKFVDDAFGVNLSDYYLIPTAEVPVTNLHRNEVLSIDQLPLKYVAWTPCFRREAGSYGKDTRGLIRQHQFNKVEMVQFVEPEKSEQAHDELVGHACRVLDLLGLTYRKVILCAGDTSFAAARCIDIEVWLPSQKTYREISSCSNFEDFQARRAGIRYRSEPGVRPQFVHTLNGSGLAIGRTVVAILENHQQQDGSIRIPDVLQPYMGGLKEIRA